MGGILLLQSISFPNRALWLIYSSFVVTPLSFFPSEQHSCLRYADWLWDEFLFFMFCLPCWDVVDLLVDQFCATSDGQHVCTLAKNTVVSLGSWLRIECRYISDE